MLRRWYTGGCRCSKGRLWEDQWLLQTTDLDDSKKGHLSLPSSSVFLWFERTQLGLELWLWL